jgi:hypothetical protein
MMKWVPRSLAIAGLLFVATSASAFPLRVPQVVFNSAPLQAYLNIVDTGINANTDQMAAQTWSVAFTGNSDFTLTLRNGFGNGTAVGVYNGADVAPALRLVFPPVAIPGWYAALHFAGGNLTVSLFDQNSVFQGQVTYPAVNPNNFGYYIQGPCGVWYSQDFRNPLPQVLEYASNATLGDYWIAFSACQSGANSTFNDVVINVQSVRPVPAANSTWGQVKNQYR